MVLLCRQTWKSIILFVATIKLLQVYPRHMLFGHTAAISCLAPASAQQGNTRVVSASENG